MKRMKQKSKALLLSVTLLVSMFAVNVLPVAAGGGDVVTIGDYECMVWTDSIDIIGYTGTDSTLTIPAKLDGYEVQGTWELTIPEHVTELVIESGVEDVALVCDTTNIENIILPDNTKSLIWSGVSDSAFYKNQDNWTDGMLYAGNWLVAVDENCSGTLAIKDGTMGVNQLFLLDLQGELKKIIYPGSMKAIDSGSAYLPTLSSLKDLVFQEGITEISMYLEESGVPSLTGLWFPDSVTNIDLSIYADTTEYNDGVAHFFETVKPTVYCSADNTVAIEYAEANGLPTQFVVDEVVSEDNKNISISNENKFMAGTKFLAEVLTSGEVYESAKTVIASLIENNEKYVVMEMNLVDADGNEMHQLENDVTVTLDVPTELTDAEKIHVFRVEDGQYIECESTVKDGKISFVTDHFSTYAFVEEKEECVEHVYGEWAVTKEATTAEKGSKERSCAVCGYKEVAEIPVVEAGNDEQKDTATEAEGSIEKAPKTGDMSKSALWSTLLVISCACVMSVVNSKKIRK